MAAETYTARRPRPSSIQRFVELRWRSILESERITQLLVVAGVIVLVALGWTWRDLFTRGSLAAAPAGPSAEVLTKSLTRLGTRPEGTFPSLDVTLVTPELLRTGTNRDVVGPISAPSLYFYVYEETHVGLPENPVRPLVRLAGPGLDETAYLPSDVRIIADSAHHRTVLVQYVLGGSLLHLQHGMGERLELIFPAPGGQRATGNVLTWDLPVRYQGDSVAATPLLTAESAAIRAPAAAGFTFTGAMVLGLFGGLLTSMWPCLFQLTAYFIPSLAGLSMEQAGAPTAAMRRTVISKALYFVSGIVIVYTATGAIVGQLAGTFGGTQLLNTYARPLSIVAGIVIIFMALRMAARARAPLVCHMPIVSMGLKEQRASGPLGTMALGVAFATGCMTCFGAALALGMVTYTVTTGSALTGATLMFLFSLGIALPLVVAAVAMAQVLPLLGKLERIAPKMALLSSLIMIGFALLLITNNYHVVSDAIAATFTRA